MVPGPLSRPACPNFLLEEFHGLCNEVHATWLMRQTLFDDNADEEKLKRSACTRFFARFTGILQEHVILQMAKLHDPAIHRKGASLTLDYVVRFGGWDKATRQALTRMKQQLDALHEKIRPARNGTLCHNDLEAILVADELGEFAKDADKPYFKTLQDFVDLVSRKVRGSPWPFDTSSKDDVETFLSAFHSATEGTGHA